MNACAPKDSYVAPSEHTYQQISFLDRRRAPGRYCQLMTCCLHQNSKQRPTAKQIVDEFEAIGKQLCIICEEAPQLSRTNFAKEFSTRVLYVQSNLHQFNYVL